MTRKPQKIWNGNVRDAALSILMEINQNQAYSNLLIHKTIEKYQIETRDRGLLTELTYGTLQHRMTLDYYLEPFIRGKLDAWVRELLRMSLYQIVYLSKIPSHAAVHEAVEIAKRRGHKRIAPTVNGILRSILREGTRSVDDISDETERIAIETSHPKWLISSWISQYGKEEAIQMAHANNEPSSITLRANRTKGTIEEVIRMLAEEDVEVQKGELVPECLHVISGNPIQTKAFQNGYITIQDESSMLPVVALDVQAGMTVLDMCAAPGGKTTFIAEKLNDNGQVFAHDIHDHKLLLIDANAKRLGLSSIHSKKGDSRQLVDLYGPESFERILLDAPCSGFGVVRRKPEIKYTKTREDIKGLVQIQEELLDTAYQLVKPGGIIVYSTCTVEYDENQGRIKQFLTQYSDMEKISLPNLSNQENLKFLDNTLQILPHHFQSDGFFIAALQKKNI